MSENKIYYSDFLVIGSGIGGLLISLKLSEIGKVNLVTKDRIDLSNSYYAQGGIASVYSDEDSFEDHIADTIKAGDYLCDRKIVEITTRSGPIVISELLKLGVRFDKKLGLEGGHSHRRILHRYDYTGKEIITTLIKHVVNNKNIKVFEYHQVVDLILKYHPVHTKPENNKVLGAYVLDVKKNKIYSFLSGICIIASGGGGKVYLYTSNPHSATGDGYAIGYKTGLNLINMEFIQFHPTCLYHPEAQNFLISEAMRGEGAVLKLKNGKRFMHKYSKMGELAPRDIVSRAIANEMKKTGDDFVYLDISFKPASFIKKRFPYIYKKCLRYQIDITKQPIPVVPAAHFFCGGIEVDEFSKTAIDNLYAVGEVSHTGLHGANRLASNSLLEASVFALRAYSSIKESKIEVPRKIREKHILWDYYDTKKSREDIIISQNWNEIRTLMINYVGIVRSRERLKKAYKKMSLILEEIDYYYRRYKPNRDFIELRNIAFTGMLIIKSSLSRKESRGSFYLEDHPYKLPRRTWTFINRYTEDAYQKAYER